MKHFLSLPAKLLLLFILFQAVSPSGKAQVAPAPSPAESIGALTLRDESIDQVLALLERWTGKTILRPQALPAATFTLTLKGNVSREEAVRALETLLTLNGVAISPLDDKFLKVTPADDGQVRSSRIDRRLHARPSTQRPRGQQGLSVKFSPGF